MKKRIAILIVLVLMVTSMGVFADKAAESDLQLEQLIHSSYGHSHSGHSFCKRTDYTYSCGCKTYINKCCCGEVMSSIFIRCYSDSKGLLDGGIARKVYPCGSHTHSNTNHKPCVEIMNYKVCGCVQKTYECCSSHTHMSNNHDCPHY